ncbi:hypothetical protein GJV14_13775 [Enterobacteriaceae bacterium RIT697]|nr:hypothetical protein [Enterobacteriaceae bacterium RIT697]
MPYKKLMPDRRCECSLLSINICINVPKKYTLLFCE